MFKCWEGCPEAVAEVAKCAKVLAELCKVACLFI